MGEIDREKESLRSEDYQQRQHELDSKLSEEVEIEKEEDQSDE